MDRERFVEEATEILENWQMRLQGLMDWKGETPTAKEIAELLADLV